ncbi:MAG: AAA family ATPase, partial [Treponema sp.]|nr:AAA family ATPase [Treponema sp.]
MDIQRKAKDALLRLAGQFPVIGITGPRQSGKTTLAKMAFPQKKYVTLDDKEMRTLAAANPKDFLQ